MPFTKPASEIFRDYVLDGNPGSGAHPPVKADIRQWGAELELQTVPVYEEGTFTPTIECATPGDLAITYLFQTGHYTKIGRFVSLIVDIVTDTFTHSTANGQVSIGGMPFALQGDCIAAMSFQGITKANYTQFFMANVAIECAGSGQNLASLQIADMPSGTTKVIRFTMNAHV